MKQDAERSKGIQRTKHRQENAEKLLGRLSKEENPHPSFIGHIRREQSSAWLKRKTSKPLLGW